jgi:hypothetical protein
VNKKHVLTAAVAAAAMSAAMFVAQSQAADAEGPPPPMSFFITSTDQDGNLGGLEGADALCTRLAQAAGSPATTTWHAYLSTQGEGAVNARDRIGNGPWHNAMGVKIADNVADLHGDVDRESNYIIQETGLDENGNAVPGRLGRAEGEANKHDIMTGSNSLGMAFPAGEDRTCNNWTSNGAGSAMLGHYDRSGGGNNVSWNAAHPSRSCSLPDLNATGGAGKLYCFAVN